VCPKNARPQSSKTLRQNRSKCEYLDNAPIESFFASLKKELIHRQRFKTRAQAKAAIFEYIVLFYNRQYRHPSIGYQTPQQAFQDMTWKMAA
jgi:putative transposase